MTNIFEKFDQQFDVQSLKEELKNVDAGDGQFREVPLGTYEVRIEKLELVQSKTGRPMLTCWMRIVSGEYKNLLLFMNQVVDTGFGLYNANQFLCALDSCVEVKFESFAQYNDLILNIHEAIDETYEYLVEYGQTSKGFNTFKITEVFGVL
jgi:hypothetical protein